MSHSGLRVYLAVLALAVGTYLLTTPGTWVAVGWQVAIGYGAAAAMVYGARRNAREEQAVWWLFAAGVFGNASGILVEQILIMINKDNSPSLADVCYLSLYPAAALGLAMLIRRRVGYRDWGALVDATTVSTGLGLLAWIFMIWPAVHDTSLSVSGRVTSMAYPVGDVVLVAMLVRLQFGARGTRTPAFWLMSSSLFLFLSGDTAWAVVNRLNLQPDNLALHALAMNYLLAYGLFGAATLHPSVRELGARGSARAPRLGPGLLALLTAAVLVAPALLVVEVLTGHVNNPLAIGLASIALMVLVVTRMAQLLRQLERQTARVRELSQTDELTGLPNRRRWSAELPTALERARRGGGPLSVAMLDLDHFKAFNDSYGHPAGDRLLKAAAAAWQEQLRGTDQLARYGGEEFIVLLPSAGAAQAREVVERLLPVTPLGQSFSAGLATWNGQETSEELVARADRALYEAKRAGRNRVVLAEPESVPVS